MPYCSTFFMISEFHYYPQIFNKDFVATQFLCCLKYYCSFLQRKKKSEINIILFNCTSSLKYSWMLLFKWKPYQWSSPSLCVSVALWISYSWMLSYCYNIHHSSQYDKVTKHWPTEKTSHFLAFNSES